MTRALPGIRPAAAAMAAAVAAVLLALAPPPQPASAHNALISADPAADSVLSDAPETVSLTFNQDIRPDLSQMAITINGDSRTVQPTVTGPTVAADVPPDLRTATPGHAQTWKIGYRIVSADGHPVSGLLQFTVGDPGAVPQTADAREQDAPSSAISWPIVGGGVAAGAAASAAAGLWIRRRRPAGTRP